jgi:hypothetical protein
MTWYCVCSFGGNKMADNEERTVVRVKRETVPKEKTAEREA